MAQAKRGDTVRVHYTGRLDDGTVFDSSEGRDPLEFALGEGQVIPGFEEGIEGMNTGESKTINIPADRAYGPRLAEMEVAIPREKIPPEIDPKVGDQLEMLHPSGQQIVVTVTQVDEQSVTLDGNHSLAGKDLTFDVELVEAG